MLAYAPPLTLALCVYMCLYRVSNIVHLKDVLHPIKVPDVVAGDMLDERRIMYSDLAAGK